MGAIAAMGRSYKQSVEVYHAHELAVLRALALEPHIAVFFRKQRVIAADADVGTRVKTRATLANNNVACQNRLAAVDFDA